MFGDVVESDNSQQYERELRELCTCKSEEFSLLGYDRVSPDDIWKCVQSLTKGTARLHEFVATILSLQIGQFMNYETMNAYKGLLAND